MGNENFMKVRFQGYIRGQNRKHNHGEGMNKGRIKSHTMTPASLYTHIKDMRVESPNFGKRVPIER